MFTRKGQNTAEYAILLALIIAAAVGMQTYVKRGLQSRLHDASTDFSAGVNDATNSGYWNDIRSTGVTTPPTLANQYEPKYLSSQNTSEILRDKVDSTMAVGGQVTRDILRRTQQASGDYQQQNYP